MAILNEPITITGGAGDDTFPISGASTVVRWYGGPGNDTFIVQTPQQPVSIDGYLQGSFAPAGEVNTLSLWSYIDVTSWDIRNINRFDFDWSSGVTLSNTQIKAGYISPAAVFDGAHSPSLSIILSDSSILDFSALQFTNWTADGSPAGFSLASSFTPSSLNLVLTSIGDRFEGRSISGSLTVSGGGGDDQITGGSGSNTLSGGDGNDTLQANATGTNSNNLAGGAGDDHLNASSNGGDNTLIGGAGNDSLQATTGGAGSNTLTGGDGDDNLSASTQGSGNNTVDGGSGNDHIGVSGLGTITITGGAGDDSIGFSGEAHGTIAGGDGNDHISGDGNFGVNGNSTGAYTIEGGAGNDDIESGDGNDTITGGSGRNYLSGGGGDDLFIAGTGIDKMHGDDGNDRFQFAAGTVQAGDAVFGGISDSQDVIELGADLDLTPLAIFSVSQLDLKGHTATVSWHQISSAALGEITSSVDGGQLLVLGNANLSATMIADGITVTMNGSAGNTANSLTGSEHDDAINGLGGNDILQGLAGDDVLNGGTGADKIYGGDGDDTILVSSGNVVAGEKWWGGFGDDTVKLISSTDTSAAGGISSVETVDLNGFAGTFLGSRFGAGKIENVVSAPAGAELITIGNADLSAVTLSAGIKLTLNGAAGTVNDVITGSVLANTINGLDGNDTLTGLGGADTIAGGNGQDLLIGGLGRDNLTGGAGADVFDFDSGADSLKGVAARDIIFDFSRVEGDKIDLSNIDASTAAAGDQAFAFIGSSAFSGVAGQLRYAAGVLMADVNGDKVADLEVSLANKFALKVGDFVL